jgi:hypothetical protein
MIEKSMLRPSRRGGVPVFRRPAGQLQLAQARGQAHRGRIAHAAGLVVIKADMDEAGKEGAGGQHHGFGLEVQAELGDGAGDAVAGNGKVVDGRLEQRQVGLILQPAADRRLVQHAVGLGARGAHRRALAGIEDAELDAGLVGGRSHGAAEGIDFLDQMPLADAANGRVAGHRPQRLDVVRQQQRAASRARRGECRLGAGMAATDNDYVITRGEQHRARSPREEAQSYARTGQKNREMFHVKHFPV